MQITLGPIVGATTPQSTKIWFRTDEAGENARFSLTIIDQNNNPLQVAQKLWYYPVNDNTGVFEVSGLTPNTHYRFNITYDQGQISSGSFQTFPELMPEPGINFIIGSCWKGTNEKHDRIFRHIIDSIGNSDARFLMLMGDQVYADEPEAAQPYERHWHTMYHMYWSPRNFRQCLGQIPTYMILDDHEIRNGWSADQVGANIGLYDVAIDFYKNYQNSHNPSSVHRNQFYYTFECGQLSFFVLDTRTLRYYNIPRKTILGEEQLTALIAWLTKDTGKLKFVVTSVPFIPDLHWTPDFNGGADKWSGFDLDRMQILTALYENRVNNVFFLAGDIHASAAATMMWKRDMNTYQLHSVISSPLRQTLRLPGFLIDKNKSLTGGLPTEFRYRTHFTYSWENNYGVVRVAQNLSRVTYEVYDDDGSQQTSYVFNL